QRPGRHLRFHGITSLDVFQIGSRTEPLRSHKHDHPYPFASVLVTFSTRGKIASRRTYPTFPFGESTPSQPFCELTTESNNPDPIAPTSCALSVASVRTGTGAAASTL